MMKKNSILLISSNVTSKIGNVVFDYANTMIITTLFPTAPIFLSVYQSTETIVSILLNLIGGAIADNFNRKKILIYTDLLSSLACFIGLLVVNSKILYLLIIIINVILSILTTLNNPVYNAMIKETIPNHYVEKHMTYFTISKEIVSIFSPIIGVIIWKFWGIKFAYIFNSLSFLLAALFSYNIEVTKKINSKPKQDRNILCSIKSGLVYIDKNKEIKYLIILSSVINLFLSYYNLALPYLSNYFKDSITNFYGIALAMQSVGAVLFPILEKKLKLSQRNNLSRNTTYLGLSIVTVFLFDILRFNIYLLFGLFIVIGGFFTLFNIKFFSMVQKVVINEYIGRVYSVIFTVSILFMPIGSIFFGLVAKIDNLLGFLFVGVGIIFSSLTYNFILKNNRNIY